MPHGKKVVGERMGSLKLPGDVKEDAVAELAAYLEEIYQNARSRSWSDPVALELAMQESCGLAHTSRAHFPRRILRG
jgi:hypothetical protein